MPAGKGLDERGGSPSVEAGVLVVTFGLLIAFAVAGGRFVAAESAVDHAARAGARVASLQRDATSALASARAVGETTLADQGLRCADLQITVDTSGFAAPLGAASSVSATARCTVAWSDLGLPVGSGGPTVESTATSALDRWRERT